MFLYLTHLNCSPTNTLKYANTSILRTGYLQGSKLIFCHIGLLTPEPDEDLLNSTLLPDEAAQEFSSSMPDQLIDGRQSRVGALIGRSVPRVSTPRPWESGLIMVKPYLGNTKRSGFTVYCRYTVDKWVTPKDFVLYIWVNLRAGKMKRIRVLSVTASEYWRPILPSRDFPL